MKKIFILLICCCFMKVNAATTNANFQSSFIGSYHYVDSNGKYGDFEKFVRSSDGAIAYCIEPGIPLSIENYVGYYSDMEEILKITNLSKEKLEKISLLAYFGYGYQNHNSIDWFVAAQTLIWQELGRVLWFTSRNNKENPRAYIIDTPLTIANDMSEINNLVNSYLKVPNIPNDITILLGDTYKISDEAFINYQIEECKNCEANFDGINLNIIPKTKESGEVILRKKFDAYEENFIIYNHSTGQDLIVAGKGIDDKVSIKYNVKTGKIIIYKYDQDSKKCEPKAGGSLAGTIFKLYNDYNEFIADIVIDENCTGVYEGLAKGIYRFYEAQAGKGYQLKENQFYLQIGNTYPTLSFTTYNKRYVGQLKLKKLDKDLKTCQNNDLSLAGAIYGIYNLDGELIQNLTLNQECSAMTERNLELGKYYIQEIKAPKGYKLDKEKHYFEINEENADGIVELNLEDEIFKTNLIINKMFFKDSKLTPEIGAIFGIYKKDGTEVTKLVIDETGRAQVTLNYGEYIIKQEKGQDGYKKVEDFNFVVDENSLEETVITLLNEKFNVNLIINKVDEDNNPINLSGIKFRLYDLNNNKYICYNNLYLSTEEVCEFSTNENGQIFFPIPLEVGKYRLEEMESFIPGFTWNKDGLEITIADNVFYEKGNDNKLYLKVNFINHKVRGRLEILKYAKDSNIPLKNALFKIYKSDGTLYKEAWTNEEGIIYLEDLEYGKYYLIEEKAPEGYTLNEDKIWFEIMDNNLIKIGIENEAIVVPQTYMKVNYFSLFGSLFLLLFGIIKYGKKNN